VHRASSKERDSKDKERSKLEKRDKEYGSSDESDGEESDEDDAKMDIFSYIGRYQKHWILAPKCDFGICLIAVPPLGRSWYSAKAVRLFEV
jgi:hypothetical protein